MLPLARRLSVIWLTMRRVLPENEVKRIEAMIARGTSAPDRAKWGVDPEAEASQNALLGGLT